MSLINQMLQDLENRPSEPGRLSELPDGVHSAAASLVSAPRWRLPVMVLAACVAIAVAGFFFGKTATPKPETILTSMSAVPEAVPAMLAAPAPPSVPPQIPLVPSAKLVMPVVSEVRPASIKAPKKVVSAKPVKPKSASRLAERAVGEARGSQKPGSVAKSSPVSESQERAEQSYRNALNAYGQGRTTESLAQARQTLVDDPGHLSARQLLVRQLVEQGATDQARAVLHDGIKLHPTQVSWSTLLARLELDRGDLQAARQVIDSALPQSTGNADFQSLAGAIAQRQGHPGDAAEFYRTALRLKPAEGRSWIGLALALEAEGHAPEAREAFRRALTTEGLSPELQALAQRKLR